MCYNIIIYSDGTYSIHESNVACACPYDVPVNIIHDGKEGKLYRVPQGQEIRMMRKLARQLLQDKEDRIKVLEEEKCHLMEMYSDYL